VRRALFGVLAVGVASAGGIDIGVNFAGLSFGESCCLVPSDMAMAVGPNQIVQLVNGGYEVFSKSGFSLTGPQSDTNFWLSAGLPVESFVDDDAFHQRFLSDPRAVYDPGSGRFFVAQINFGTDFNLTDFSSTDAPVEVLLAISKNSDPQDGWNALSFIGDTGFSSGFLDFPTLGLDGNALYIGSNNFALPDYDATSISIFSVPKADLLGSSPSLARLSTFGGLANSSYGAVPQPAIDTGGSHGVVLAGGPNLHQATLTTVAGSDGGAATLSSPTVLGGLLDGEVVPPLQPDGSVVTTNIDNRFSAPPVVVGNLLYAANSVGDAGATSDFIHWMIVDLTSQLVLEQGAISDPGFFYNYPSIAANANGDFVLGFNRSAAGGGPENFLSAYAAGCHYDGTSAGCGSPVLLRQGGNLTSDNRWGDYSVTAIDPTNSNVFWTAIEVTSSDGTWSTQITQLTATPEPGTIGLLAAGLGWLVFRRGRGYRGARGFAFLRRSGLS
jgi:hypothetical protein